MPQWLEDLLSSIPGPDDAHWTTRRRMAITTRCPAHRQQEALLDAANGRPERLAELNGDIDAIKAAIPKGQ